MTQSSASPPLTNLLPLEEARTAMDEHLVPMNQVEFVKLLFGMGRVCADDVETPISLPPFANAAVDGVAVAHATLKSQHPSAMPLYGDGHVHCAGDEPFTLPAGQGVRIMTGAVMPHQADTVLPQELCDVRGSHVTLPLADKGVNCRAVGEDVAAHSVIIKKGTRLRPQDIALAAAAGHNQLPVYHKQPVAIFSSGNELREPAATPLTPAHIHDANRYGLIALLNAWGANLHDMGILPDDSATVTHHLEAITDTLPNPLIVTSGGISTGASDVISHYLHTHGEFAFWRVAIKPGRPIGFGRIGTTPIMALPGNPVAALVTAMIVLRHVFFRLQGRAFADYDIAPFSIPSAFAMNKKKGRREYLRASRTAAGTVDKFATTGAGILTSLTASDGLLILDEQQERIAQGDPLPFIPFSSYLW